MKNLTIGSKNMANTLSKRLEKIRIGFLFDHPFLSVLALSIAIKFQKNPHEALETDGVVIYVDEVLCQGLDMQVLKYKYAHILLHILLKHPFRMNAREQKTWNRSSDIVVNLLLKDFTRVGVRPEDEVVLEKFEDMSVEAVYNALYQESQEGEEGDEQNPQQDKRDLIENKGEDSAVTEEIDALIVQALGTASKLGSLPPSFLEAVQEITKPKIDLQTLLHTYLTESFFDKTTDFSNPNRRFIHKNLYLPGYKKEQNRLSLYIALDRSMSISQTVFAKFLGIIDATLRMSTDFHVVVLPFDTDVDESNIVRFEAQDAKIPEVKFSKGNGGTVFDSVWEYLQDKVTYESTLMVLSDGLFKIEKPPQITTLFLISEKKNMKRVQAYGDVFYFDL